MCDSGSFPHPDHVKAALSHLDNPVVFKNQTNSWNSIPWTPPDLSDEYGNVLLDFRLVPKTFTGISWEGKASFFVEATISQFLSWQNGMDIESDSPLRTFDKSEYWAYSSYNHMNRMFPQDSDILEVFNWENFGFPEVTGKQSTFWLGSTGAYTPCHSDTYGYNLHAQIIGRKRWVLFPPEDTSFMYPTRIPYEESSVFSSVNVMNPDLSLHPLFKNSHPHEVILEPGDVIFIPKKWWHFVMNLDDVTYSVNSWIEFDSDLETRLEEKVVRSLMSCFITSLEPAGETWLNPKELFMRPDRSLSLITSVLRPIKNLNASSTPVAAENLRRAKIARTRPGTDVHSNSRSGCCIQRYADVITIMPIPFEEWITRARNANGVISPHRQEMTELQKIVNCFVHPDVVAVISRLLKDM